MRRRNKAFAPNLVEPLEHRVTPSGQGIHHAALIAPHHSALVHEHHTALAGHHHAARLHHHHPGPGTTTAGSKSTGTTPAPTTGGTTPAATGSDPTATGSGSAPSATGSTSGGSDPTSGGSGPTSGGSGSAGGSPGPTSGGSGSTGDDPGPTSGGSGSAGGGSGSTSVAVVLVGTVKGTAPLDGSGTVGSLGAVTTTGTMTTSGAEPVIYTGEITLVSATGNVTAELSGRLFGPSRLDETIDMTYTITGGTGAFQGATGSGQAVLTTIVSSTGESFSLAFGADTSTAA